MDEDVKQRALAQIALHNKNLSDRESAIREREAADLAAETNDKAALQKIIDEVIEPSMNSFAALVNGPAFTCELSPQHGRDAPQTAFAFVGERNRALGSVFVRRGSAHGTAVWITVVAGRPSIPQEEEAYSSITAASVHRRLLQLLESIKP